MVARSWFKKNAAREPAYYGQLEQGDWQTVPHEHGALSLDDHDDRPLPGVRMLLIPSRRPWEVVGRLRFGRWNRCPRPAVHIAVHQYWFDVFGAEPMNLADDIVEMFVARPPATQRAAAAPAYEQFIYSGGDLVFQGSDTLLALASSLRNSPYWYFWWD